MNIHPWNTPLWQSLLETGQELSQAVLLSGLLGLGKNTFALSLAMKLLCQTPAQGQACQTCRSCHLLVAGSHPDFHVLSAGESTQSTLPDLLLGYRKRYTQDEEKTSKVKKEIPVARIQLLTQALFSSAHTSACKVVLISPAERMNRFAANALLKFLEEPVGRTYLLLVSHQSERLPATIRSRCATIPFRSPASDRVLPWLAQQLPKLQQEDLLGLLSRAGHSPLTALALAAQQQRATECAADVERLLEQHTTACDIAEKWQQQKSVTENLQHLQRLLAETIRLRSTTKTDSSGGLATASLSNLFAGYDRSGRALQDLQGNLDPRLLVEDILLALSATYNGSLTMA